MAILSKGHKPDTFESDNSLKLSFTNIWGLCSILLLVNLSLNETLLRQTWMTELVLAISLWRVIFLSSKIILLYAWSCILCDQRTSFYTGRISRKLCRFLFMFLTGFTSLSVLLLLPPLITFVIFMHSFWCCFF